MATEKSFINEIKLVGIFLIVVGYALYFYYNYKSLKK